jgi:hypothetical protein
MTQTKPEVRIGVTTPSNCPRARAFRSHCPLNRNAHSRRMKDSKGRTIWIADAHRDNGKRFIVHADEILTAFLELEAAIRENTVDIVYRQRAKSRSR